MKEIMRTNRFFFSSLEQPRCSDFKIVTTVKGILGNKFRREYVIP